MIYAEYLGWLVSLFFVFVVCAALTKGTFALVLNEARAGREVSLDDLLEHFVAGFEAGLKFFFVRRLAGTLAAIAVFVLSRSMAEANWFAALGLSSAAFVIAGVATPALLGQLRSGFANVRAALSRKQPD